MYKCRLLYQNVTWNIIIESNKKKVERLKKGQRVKVSPEMLYICLIKLIVFNKIVNR